jgi:acetolactate synthase I/II/III large subunit
MERINGSQALIRSLLKEDVDTIFGYPGGTIMPLYDELYNFTDSLRHILVRHEQGAVHAAEGYSRVSGKTGVCIATAGPGATNLITGIADAYMDSTPLVCITAQVSADKLGTNFFQEADIISLTIPVTKWSFQITKPNEIQEIIAKAFYISKTGRPGPVLLSITKNSQTEFTDYDSGRFFSFEIPCFKRRDVEINDINRAACLLNEAVKPMIIAGQGVIVSGAEKELVKLSETSGIPVVTTLMGISLFPTKHPLFAGNAGMHGNIAANRMIQESDLILAIGMRFSDRVTGDTSKFAPKAKIIHADIDKSEFNKTIKSDIQIHGDAFQIISKLHPLLLYKERKEWKTFIEGYKKIEYENVIDKLFNNALRDSISMAQAVDAISEVCNGEMVIVSDVGQHQMFCARYSTFANTRSFITSGGLGTMGFGLPAAIGAKMAAPERYVIAVTGDGGFQMTLQELGTIMQFKINLKVVILNNSYLGMVRQWQELFFDKRYSSTEMENPDFITIANAYGIETSKVSTIDELKEGVRKMIESKGAYLLEIIVDKEENVYPMIPSGASLDDIIY